MQTLSLLKEWGCQTQLIIHTDSNAAKQSVERLGVQRVKHLQLKDLFLEQLAHAGLVTIKKIPMCENVADLLTKPLSSA